MASFHHEQICHLDFRRLSSPFRRQFNEECIIAEEAAWLLARLASDEQKSNLPKATLLTSLLPWDINESSKLYILYFVISAASKSSSHDVLCLLISRFLVSSH